MNYPLVIRAMGGIGDSVYQRPFIRLWAEREPEVFLRTPWPELFTDIPGLRFVYPDSMLALRTQAKNMARQSPERWARGPLRARDITPWYMLKAPGVTAIGELARSFGLGESGPLRFDLPDFGKSPVRYKRYAVIRPVTHRKEWFNPARSPSTTHIAQASRILRRMGYRVVSVADVDGEREWMEGPELFADKRFDHGELELPRLMALVQNASVVVGGVGWIVPVSIAAGVPAVFIAGGAGRFNAPGVVTDPRMDLSRVQWLMPENYCFDCFRQVHACPKRISHFEARFTIAVNEATRVEAAA